MQDAVPLGQEVIWKVPTTSTSVVSGAAVQTSGSGPANTCASRGAPEPPTYTQVRNVPDELHSWLDHACEPTSSTELIRSHVPVVLNGGPPLTAVMTKLVRLPALVRARIWHVNVPETRAWSSSDSISPSSPASEPGW